MSKKDRLDSLKLVKRLTAAGFSQDQAEVQIEILSEILLAYQVTKHDLNVLYLKIVFTTGGVVATATAVILSMMAELIN